MQLQVKSAVTDSSNKDMKDQDCPGEGLKLKKAVLNALNGGD